MQRNMIIGISSAIFFAVFAVALFNCVEYLDAKHIMVIQYPNGDMATFSEPGPKPQWFGTATKYPRRVTFSFSNSDNCTQSDRNGYSPFKVQFNDGGEASLCGSLQWEMPIKPEQLVRLQKDYSSVEAIDQQLVKAALNNAIYFAGPVMSSIESTADRKSEFLQYIEDQLRNGIYKVSTRSEKQKDDITGVEKTVRVVEIQRDAAGLPLRSGQGSAFHEYGIQVNTLAISEMHYDDAVKGQLKKRQDSINSVQLAIASARRAEQDKLTTEAQGAANAAKAKWEQETIKAKFVTEAQQKLEVAQLGAKEAEQIKQQQILLGQGEAERKRLVMSADGALDKKLEALVEINGMYATAIKDYKGNWVPNVAMGASSGGNTGLALIDLLTAKTARDLGIDMSVSGKGSTGK